MDLSSNISGSAAIALLILGFGFIIFVHELGHFLVAKWVGVKVTQFAIGFGHALVCWRQGIGFRVGTTEPDYNQRLAQHLGAEVDPNSGMLRRDGRLLSPEQIERANAELGLGETEYRLNWMPLGGYVKMVGQEDMDPTATSDDPRAFNNKPIWARVCVVSAGVIMNAIFAVLFFQIAFLSGVEFPPAEVGSVQPGSPAAKTPAANNPDIIGMRPGDQIVAIDGKKPSDFTSVRIASALAEADDTVHFEVMRPALDGSEAQRLSFNIKPEPNERMEGLLYIGVAPPSSLKLISRVNADSQLATLFDGEKLKPGMKLTAVNGQPVEAFWQFEQRVDEAAGQPVELTFSGEQGERVTVTRKPITQYQTAQLPAPEDSQQTVNHLLGMAPAVKIEKLTDDSVVRGVIEPGDVIAELDGEPWPTLPMVMYLVSTYEGKTMNITVLRDGELKELTVEPAGNQLTGRRLGVMLNNDTHAIAQVLEDSPITALNLKPGTILHRIGDRPISNATDIRLALAAAEAGPVEFSYTLPVAGMEKEQQTVELTREQINSVASLDWGVDLPPFQTLRVMQKADGPIDAIVIGFDKTMLFMKQTYVTLHRLVIERTVGVKNLRGPVGIAVEGTRIAEQGVAYLLFFLGLISINLAVINFLPLPIVDGGLFILLMIEKLRGKPVPPQVQSAITVAGLILLGTIFLVVTFHDIGRIFS